MLGRDDDYVSALERAHSAHLQCGDALPAIRCAWWIGHNFLFRGEMGPAKGWFARAQRLLGDDRGDCVERGYVLIPALLERLFAGDHEGVHATAVEIVAIGERFGDRGPRRDRDDGAGPLPWSGRGARKTGCASSTRRWSP